MSSASSSYSFVHCDKSVAYLNHDLSTTLHSTHCPKISTHSNVTRFGYFWRSRRRFFYKSSQKNWQLLKSHFLSKTNWNIWLLFIATSGHTGTGPPKYYNFTAISPDYVDEVKFDLNDLVRRRDDVQAAGLDVVQALGVVDVVAGIVHRLNAFCWSKLKTIVLENFCRRRPFGNSDNLKCTVQLTDPVPCVLYLCISFYNYINKRPTYPHSLDLYDLDLYRL